MLSLFRVIERLALLPNGIPKIKKTPCTETTTQKGSRQLFTSY